MGTSDIASTVIAGVEGRDVAVENVRFLYSVLETQPGIERPNCGVDCEHHTPICTYTEAEYILSHLPAARYFTVMQKAEEWLTSGGEKANTVGEVKAVRGERCPFLTAAGSCLLTVQPLECWVHRTDQEITELVGKALRGAVAAYPQRTGFVAAQLYAFAHQEEYRMKVAAGEIAPVRANRGTTIGPVMAGSR